MLRFMVLLHTVALLTTSVQALPSGLSPPRTIHEYRDSSRSLANPLLLKNPLADTTNLTIPTINYPELNISNNVGAMLDCYRNPPPPARPNFGRVDLVECGILIMALLGAERADLPILRWSPIYPLKLPYTGGTSPYCKFTVSAVHAGSSDIFPSVMIAQRLALVLNYCAANNGGLVSLGPREEFSVQVFSTMWEATA